MRFPFAPSVEHRMNASFLWVSQPISPCVWNMRRLTGFLFDHTKMLGQGCRLVACIQGGLSPCVRELSSGAAAGVSWTR